MSLAKASPETLHKHIVDTYKDDGFAVVEGLGTWLVSIDCSVEPPIVHLTDPDGVIFMLDGNSIHLGTNNVPFTPLDDPLSGLAGLTYLQKLFGN